MGKRRRVKIGYNPIPEKRPRVDPAIIDSLSQNPVWQIGALDLEGPWGWHKIDSKLLYNTVIPKIKNFEKMRWNEILGPKNHEIKINELSKTAQKRLTVLNLDDFDSLVSLRLTGRKRIWGIKIENICKVLWWDPEHAVCPSKLKHT